MKNLKAIIVVMLMALFLMTSCTKYRDLDADREQELRDSLQSENNKRDFIINQKDNIISGLKDEIKYLEKELVDSKKTVDLLEKNKEKIFIKLDSLIGLLSDTREALKTTKTNKKALQSKYNSLEKKYKNLKALYEITCINFKATCDNYSNLLSRYKKAKKLIEVGISGDMKIFCETVIELIDDHNCFSLMYNYIENKYPNLEVKYTKTFIGGIGYTRDYSDYYINIVQEYELIENGETLEGVFTSSNDYNYEDLKKLIQ